MITFDYTDLPDPNMTISTHTNAIAGKQLVLTCTVRVVEHLISVPSVEWSGGSVGRRDGVVEGNTTRIGVVSKKTLTFNPLHTSHGALYTCTARLIDHSINFIKTGIKDARIFVQSQYFILGTYRLCYKMFLSCLSVPQPTVVIRRSHNGLIHAGSDFTLNAEISINDPTVVDMEISMTISWSTNDNIITSNNCISISPVTLSKSGYTASITYSPITTSDSGLITATLTVSPSDDSIYIKSVTANETHTINVEGIHCDGKCTNTITILVFAFLTYITILILTTYK